MNAIALLDLALACAPIMPTEAASRASPEWRHFRIQWLAALKGLRLSEDRAREMASRLIALAPSASPVWIKDRTGTATIAAAVDGAASFAFKAAGDGVTLVYSPDESQWLQF